MCKKSGFIILVVLVAALINVTVGEDKCVKVNDCSCEFEDGRGIDLKSLETVSYLSTPTDLQNTTYIYHPCSDSTKLPPVSFNKTFNECSNGYSLCVLNFTGNYSQILAKAADVTFTTNSEESVFLTYKHNSHDMIVKLACVNNLQESFLHFPQTQDATLNSLILFSPHACVRQINDRSGLSTGSVLIILLSVAILCYLGIGVTINYMLLGARGIEVIPHLDFWKDFPNLVLDGIKYVHGGCKTPQNQDSYDAI